MDGLLMIESLFILLYRQDSANRRAAYLQPPGDLGFADTSTPQFPDFPGLSRCRGGSAEFLSVLPCVGQASPRSVPQNLPFELREYSQQASHRSTGWRGQVQCLSQRNETDAKMFQFL